MANRQSRDQDIPEMAGTRNEENDERMHGGSDEEIRDIASDEEDEFDDMGDTEDEDEEEEEDGRL